MPSREGRQSRRNAYRIAFLVVAVIGAALSADLIRLHLRVYTDPDFSSFCAVSEGVNCETVALSDYSVVFGLPLAVWGFIAYFALGGLAIWGLRSRRTGTWPFGALFWICALVSALGVVLFAISHFRIRSICIVCIGTYTVNFALWALAYAVLRRERSGPLRALASELRSARRAPGDIIWYVTGLATVVVVLLLTVPSYWLPEAIMLESQDMPTGRTEDGHPWIGAEDPVLEIVEYSDYQCPHCRRAHFALREVMGGSKARIRLVHRHFPLDDACNPLLDERFHPRACEYSVLAHCAGQQDAFWRANDYLFANGGRRSPIQTKELARALSLDQGALESCARGQEARRVVESDLDAGRKMGFQGTPTYVVGGRAYLGHVPTEILRRAIESSEERTPD